MLFIDIDNFRIFNNQYGHPIGDTVLKKVCESIQFDLRAVDRIYRYGGEEFLILLKDCKKEAAYNVAEKLRLNINKLDNAPYPAITMNQSLRIYYRFNIKFKYIFIKFSHFFTIIMQ